MLMACLAACEMKEFSDDGETSGAGESGTGDGCPPGDGDGDGDPGDGCTSPFVSDSPPLPDIALPISSNEVFALPLGGYLRYIQREGADTTVLIFAGLGGQWSSASSYLQSVDTTTIMPTANLAVVEIVNHYGMAHDFVTIDPALFTPGPGGESPFVTWGWWVWNEGDDPYDPTSPGAYPILIETGDAIEAIVGDVDVFVQLGKEAGGRTYGCGAGSQYDCNGYTVMAYGGIDSYSLAESVSGQLAELEPEWDAWDLDHPLGGGFVYDDPWEGNDRWLGTAAQWANVTWGARAIEIILPTNAPADRCAPLLVSEPSPQSWPASGDYRMRSQIERMATVAAGLSAVSDQI